jgi:hypothetical protein
MPLTPAERREHWRQVHIRGDAGPEIHRTEERRPFWKPVWVERALDKKWKEQRNA